MAGAGFCHVCRAMLTPSDEARSPGACPYCGAETHFELDRSNPYAPPRAELGAMAHEAESVSGVPPTFRGKLRFAFKLLFGDFFLIATLVLMVWFPGNLLIGFLTRDHPDLNQQRQIAVMQLTNLVEGVFGPIYMGGILNVLANRMTGRSSSYAEAIRVGFHNWGRLIGARFFTGLRILIGFIPIISFVPGYKLAREYNRRGRVLASIIAFFLPGFVLATRYALLDSAVVLEGMGGADARDRSTELVRGRGLEIFAGGALYVSTIIVLSAVLATIPALHPSLNNMLVIAAIDCVLNVFSVIINCFLFAYFWEGRIRNSGSLDTELAAVKSAGINDEL